MHSGCHTVLFKPASSFGAASHRGARGARRNDKGESETVIQPCPLSGKPDIEADIAE